MTLQNENSNLKQKLGRTNDSFETLKDELSLRTQERDQVAQEKRDLEVNHKKSMCSMFFILMSHNYLNFPSNRPTVRHSTTPSWPPNKRLPSMCPTLSSSILRSLSLRASSMPSWQRRTLPCSRSTISRPLLKTLSRRCRDWRLRRTSWNRTSTAFSLP